MYDIVPRSGVEKKYLAGLITPSRRCNSGPRNKLKNTPMGFPVGVFFILVRRERGNCLPRVRNYKAEPCLSDLGAKTGEPGQEPLSDPLAGGELSELTPMEALLFTKYKKERFYALFH